MAWIYYLILLAILLLGLFINLLTLPGLWLMSAALAGYALVTGWNVYVGWTAILVLLVLAAIGEALEFYAGASGSKAAGGRRRGAIGAIIGGIVGGIFFTGMIPIPPIGTIVGVCFGTFLGAAIAELSSGDVVHSFRVGIGAAKGRLAGIIIKLAIGIVMLLIALFAALPIHANKPAKNPPLLLPATRSTTSRATTLAV